MAHAHLQAAVHPVESSDILHRAGIAGMLMYPLFAGTVVLLTWLEWDFLHGTGWTVLDEHTVNYPSALARGDLGLLQSLNFLVLSALAFVFSQGCAMEWCADWDGPSRGLRLPFGLVGDRPRSVRPSTYVGGRLRRRRAVESRTTSSG